MKAIPENAHITWQLQTRTCGKKSCLCATDKSRQHGPYWYGYWREGKAMKCFYAGKIDPRPTSARKEQHV